MYNYAVKKEKILQICKKNFTDMQTKTNLYLNIFYTLYAKIQSFVISIQYCIYGGK